MKLHITKWLTLTENAQGYVDLETDRKDRYRAQCYTRASSTPITDWWQQQYQSDLRRWQLDIFVKEIVRLDRDADPVIYTLWQQNAGFQQPHDCFIVYHPKRAITCVSTTRYHWLRQGEPQGRFLVEDSWEADLLTIEGRKRIYKELDRLNETKHAPIG